MLFVMLTMTTATIIDFNKPVEGKCSFCKKPEKEVKKLFSNNLEAPDTKYICNECIVKSKTLLVKDQHK